MFFPACAISFFQVVQVVIRGESVRGGETGGAVDATSKRVDCPLGDWHRFFNLSALLFLTLPIPVIIFKRFQNIILGLLRRDILGQIGF